MPAIKKSIPLHKLRESTDQGFHIERVYTKYTAKDAILMGAHRDDHYIFLLQETGHSKMMVDFQQFTLKKGGLFFVLPGQVHHYLNSDPATTGWFVALDAGLVPDMFRMVLEDPLLSVKPLQIQAAGLDPLLKCLQLIDTVNRQEPAPPYTRQMIYGLLTSFVAMVSAVYTQEPKHPAKGHSEKLPRSLAITQQFRKSLALHYKTLKSPMEYAVELNISLSYLNEVVKTVSGFSVTYWIQQEVILEAKRLLYHSDCSVKEIAYELGYEDHAYFSRLFKKTVQLTPGAFRRNYRE